MRDQLDSDFENLDSSSAGSEDSESVASVTSTSAPVSDDDGELLSDDACSEYNEYRYQAPVSTSS